MDKKLKDCGVILTEDHQYWMGDKRLFGITGIISRQLFPDKYKAVPEKILKAAAARGTKVHEDLEMYDMFGIAESEQAKQYADLKKEKKFEVVDNEYIVTDYTDFATPIDKLVRFKDTPKGVIDLADVKNTAVLDKLSLSWQLSICKYLFNIVNPGVKVGKFYAIWTRNGVSLHEIEEIPQEEVIELLNCEREGRQYIRKDVVTVADEKAIAVVRELSSVLVEIAELEAKRDAMKKGLEDMFEQFGVEKWQTDAFTITRVKGSTRDTFDSKKFKEDNPELYAEYIRTSEVKPSIRIKLK